MIQHTINKRELIEKVQSEINGHLDALNQGMKENDQEKIKAAKEELAIIHETLVVLGYYPAKVQVPQLV